MAIDRAAMSRYMQHDIYTPAYSIVPKQPGYSPVLPDWAALPDETRNAQALQQYRLAGYSSQRPLEVVLSTPAQGPNDRHYMEAITANWRKVLGARVALDQPEYRVMQQSAQLHKLVLFQFAWDGDYLDPMTFLQIFQSGSQFNYGGYANPAYDALVASIAREPDSSRRAALIAQAQKLLIDDAAFIPLFHYATSHLIKDYVKGWQLNVIDRNPSRYMYVLEHHAP
jgi:oligopeptide transport system substrate-binding protein